MTFEELPHLLKQLDKNPKESSGQSYLQAIELLKPYGLIIYYDDRLHAHAITLREKFLFANKDFDINSHDRDNL
jgi:hypothetical protein